jgi:RNA polymerase sigma-70 factor (ECF subfamily)
MSLDMTIEVEQLVQQAKEGQISAMKVLYDYHRERIMKLAFSYTRNMEDAEEVLQETFAKAFIALKKNKLKENRSFSSWLYRIGINSSLDLVKKRGKIRVENFNPDLHHSPQESLGNTPEQQSIRLEMAQVLDQALHFLSPNQRLIFTMKHFQHLKIREIAGHLGCSEGNVKQQLFRAVHRLKRHLGPYLQEARHEM